MIRTMLRNRVENCWQSAKNLIWDYSEHSTIHGVNYIAGKKRSWCERVWWIVALCASVLGCAKLIYDAWQISPIIISFTSKPTPIWQIPFPAVTICPTIPTDHQNLRNILYKARYGDIPLHTVSKEEQQHLIALNSFCPNVIGFVDQKKYTNCSGCLEMLRKIMIPMDQMFFECKYRDQVVNCKDLFKEVGLNQGICYSFNEVGLFRNLRDTTENKAPVGWMIDEGYASKATLDTYPLRATGTGAKFGLTMLLGYKRKALNPLCEKKSGFWVEYRMQYDVPRFTTRYVTASVGNSIIISIDPKLMATSKPLRAYSATDRKCFFSNERQLKYFVQYTQSNCETECETDAVLENCGCRLMFIDDIGDIGTCGPSHADCIIAQTEDVQFVNHLGCNCLPACTSITFESEVLVNELNITDLRRTHRIIKPNYVYTKLTIFFNRNQFLTSQRNELYGRTEFLANCGGLLGLFLGASVISFLELFYFCCIRLWFNRIPAKTAADDPRTEGITSVLKRLAADYFNKSTIHGIKYISNLKLTLTERFWWTLVLVLSIFCCGSLISNIFWQYKRSPVTINLATGETSISKIPFPAFTVCPQVSGFHVEDLYYYFKTEKHSIYDANQNFTDAVTALAHICDPEVFGDLDPLSKTNCDKCSEQLLNMTGGFNDHLIECEGSSLFPCYGIFKNVMTEEGVCFTFNGLNVFRKNNDTEPESPLFDSDDWTLERGYESNTSIWDIFPVPGAKFGLNIVFTVSKIMNDPLCKGPVRGFKLFLHLPNEAPHISKHYYLLPYDHVTQISIKPTMITSALELRQLPVEKRQCYFNDERHLRLFRHYTQNNCEIECLVNATIRKCGCVRFHLPRVPGVKYCGISDITCYRSVSQQAFMVQLNQTQSPGCRCLPACTSISYDAEINQIFSTEILPDAEPEFLEDFDLSGFSVGFKESQFVAMQRSLLYGKTEFVANFGSFLSLFLGFSFMSVVELVYYCTIRLICHLRIKDLRD